MMRISRGPIPHESAQRINPGRYVHDTPAINEARCGIEACTVKEILLERGSARCVSRLLREESSLLLAIISQVPLVQSASLHPNSVGYNSETRVQSDITFRALDASITREKPHTEPNVWDTKRNIHSMQ